MILVLFVVAGGEVDYVTWEDLLVGRQVAAYGRTYQIYACDAFTRQWLREHKGVTDMAPDDPSLVPRDHYGDTMKKNSPTRGASDDGEGKRPDYRKQPVPFSCPAFFFNMSNHVAEMSWCVL